MVKDGDLALMLKEKNYLNGFNITKFSEDLLNDLDKLEGWPNKVLTMQKIGLVNLLVAKLILKFMMKTKQLEFLRLDQTLFLGQAL